MIRQNCSRKAFAAAFLTLVLLPCATHAEDLSVQQLIDGRKVSRPRSLSAPERPAASADDLSFVDRLRHNRSLSGDDRERLAKMVAVRPKIDVDINFDYNSAALAPKSESQLNNLGKALTAPELAGSVITLSGFTDAKGGDEYNQRLSERRAEAVKRFLVENYHLPAANLITVGYGKTHLKNTADPLAAENRRTQVANLEGKEQAAR
jgi:outer membrane protein OmpA-like peptidoglycan-associated protein